MKRGERALWRHIARAAQQVVDSENYAVEYVSKLYFDNMLKELREKTAK